MKKILLLGFIICSMVFTANAQDVNGNKNAIGIRGAWGVEVSYQRYVAAANRIETTLGLNRYGFNATGTYQWLFDIKTNVKGQFKWYAGAGANIGAWTSDKFKNGFSIGVLGQIGVEYGFESLPLLLSADYRPGLNFAPKAYFDWTGFAVGVRYCF